MTDITPTAKTIAPRAVRLDAILWPAWFIGVTAFGADFIGSAHGDLKHYARGAVGGFFIAFGPFFLAWIWRNDKAVAARMLPLSVIAFVALVVLSMVMPAHLSDVWRARP